MLDFSLESYKRLEHHIYRFYCPVKLRAQPWTQGLNWALRTATFGWLFLFRTNVKWFTFDALDRISRISKIRGDNFHSLSWLFAESSGEDQFDL